MNISIALDAPSMAKLERMLHLDFGPTYYGAMSDSVQMLENTAVDYMFSTFKAPSGELEGAFIQTITPGANEITGELANPSDHAFRRNYGFSGRTDSLGRFYPDDPGINYMGFSLTTDTDAIFSRFVLATQNVLASLGGI